MRIFLFALISIVSVGCGSQEFFFAKRARFQVNFAKKLVQVSFEMNPDFQIRDSRRVGFSELGSVFIREKSDLVELGSALSADRVILAKNWAASTWHRLPNNRALPASIHSGSIKSILSDSANLQVGLLYQDSPDLIAGGTLRSDHFQKLPSNFFATQVFRAKNGTVEASISVSAPTAKSKGGIFFFGNFGVNPFPPDRSAILLEDYPADMVWELEADEPAVIMSGADTSFSPLQLYRLMMGLQSEIQSLDQN